ncbi:divergent polysaccharide deacetylase family protein [Enterovibrio sp. ZSDZ35]|uniref:Divergent polysaccharide deacetylase family protein n=1 Tax=Enterovibrio qingdaonensis TaxID=2899818 RepID=A0ABT5QN94_9GAMM|nr:divergent polysaccharide deacetylase family protein [Enterovibrio sp. ZSDZ35]MDD1782069.1 divergent polysaccharide deacetylase family protein [Enterovibrio sp. ZSDZ35]
MQRIVAVTTLLILTLAEPVLASPTPADAPKPRLALIIDDLGYDMMPREVAALPPEISVSVIPFTEFDTAVALSALSQHREVLLHLPMQSPAGTPQEPNSLTLSMTKAEMQSRIQEALYRVPQVVAVNNHMGSLLTQHKEPMHWLMELLESQNIGFVDSRTTPRTVAQRVAKEHGLANNRRHVFLDHYPNEAFILNQLELAIEQAKKRGTAVVIAHPLPVTLETLKAVLPKLLQEVELVPISAALRQ